MTMGALEVTSSVWPSAAACTTPAVPKLPPAPALFSTTTVWPSTSCKPLAKGRAAMSEGPPGGQGTTMVKGLPGQP